MTNYICCQYLNTTARSEEHTQGSIGVVKRAAAHGTTKPVAC